MISAGLILLVSVFLIVPITNSAFEFKGILIDNLVEGAPAEIAGLESGDILLGIDGTTLNRTNINFLLSDPNPGDEVVFQLEDRNVSINTIAHTDDGLVPYYGIFMKSEIDVKPSVASKFGKFPWLLFYLLEFLNWFFTLSLGIGLANLLPLGPVDGGRMTLVGLTKYFPKERAQRVWKQISFFILLILLLNLAFPFLKKLIHPVL